MYYVRCAEGAGREYNMPYEDRMKQIEDERQAQLKIIWAAQDRMKELNTQRQNLVMSQEG